MLSGNIEQGLKSGNRFFLKKPASPIKAEKDILLKEIRPQPFASANILSFIEDGIYISGFKKKKPHHRIYR